MIEYKTGIDCIDWKMLTELYGQVGLVAGQGKDQDVNLIQKVFKASTKVVTAWNNGKLIGSGRLLTDWQCYGNIYDLGVLPEFQQQGIGKGIMVELMNGLEHLCIHLTSTFGNERFYSKLGFLKHKTAMSKYPYQSEYLDKAEECQPDVSR